jgi:hypothetical protein
MPRISITFYKDVFNQLQGNATQKQISIAHYVRDLVDIGLRVEEAAAKNAYADGSQKSEIDELGDLKKLWENDLSWLLESLHLIRYLIRHLVHNEKLSPEENRHHTDGIINKAKDKAQSYVNGLLCDRI